MAGILHLLLDPGCEAIEACRAAARPGDTVLLADRGVGALLSGWPADWSVDITCLALGADVEARAVRHLAEKYRVGLLDDAQWPSLVRGSRHVLSWK